MTLGQDDVTMDPDEDVIAILTGHQLKDPDYTVNYHLDNLYEHAIYENHLIKKSGKIQSTFANKPTEIGPDKEKIIRLLKL